MHDVDIILPVFNAEKTVAAALTSIAAQTTLNRIHLIIVDDGSTDESLAAIADSLIGLPMLEERSEIVALRQNSGSSTAYRAGLEAAKGEWIARCDDDDFLMPDAIERLLAKAVEDGADIVAGTIERRTGKKSAVLTPRIEAGLNRMRLDTVNFSLCNKLIRRSLLYNAPDGVPLAPLEGINCWDDLSFVSRLLALPGVRTGTVDGNPVYIYNVFRGSESLSRSDREYILGQHIRCASMLQEWFEANGLAATCAPFLTRLKFIAKVKLLRGRGSVGRIREWQRVFPETTPFIMSRRVMGPDVSLPLRIAFKIVASL